MWNRDILRQASTSSDDGFTLLEMVVAMVILTTGLLALASTIGFALLVSNRGRGVTNTKLLVVSMLEQMETLRDTGQLTFGQIANTGQVTNPSGASFAGFPNGFLPVSSNPGPDGLFGTADDLTDPGKDQKYGTPDDFTNNALARAGFSREIVITALSSQIKRVQITLRYSPNGSDRKELVGVSYLHNNARGNYLK
jgi:prepilin-type N-terminal cleavage/methylation domain-containing protein